MRKPCHYSDASITKPALTHQYGVNSFQKWYHLFNSLSAKNIANRGGIGR
jgi:hypothetical protein